MGRKRTRRATEARTAAEPPAQRTGPERTASRDPVVAAIALVGLAIAGYLTVTRVFSATLLFCEAGGGCDAVQASRYATLLGVPTAAWGVAFYAAALSLALGRLSAQRWFRLVLLAVAGVAFSAYLTYLEIFVVRALCGWCLASAVVSVALLAAVLLRRPPAPRYGPAPRSGRRLAWPAAVAAAAAVLGASVLFDVRLPGHATPYQEGLARHLAQSGAVMYGAYW